MAYTTWITANPLVNVTQVLEVHTVEKTGTHGMLPA